jgi:hypothetical protein
MQTQRPSVRARNAILNEAPYVQRTFQRLRAFAAPAAAMRQPSGGPVLPPPARVDSLTSPSRLHFVQRGFLQQQKQQRRQRRSCQPPAALPEALAFAEASPARDFAAAALAVVGSVCLIKFFDTLERMGMIDKV